MLELLALLRVNLKSNNNTYQYRKSIYIHSIILLKPKHELELILYILQDHPPLRPS